MLKVIAQHINPDLKIEIGDPGGAAVSENEILLFLIWVLSWKAYQVVEISEKRIILACRYISELLVFEGEEDEMQPLVKVAEWYSKATLRCNDSVLQTFKEEKL
jgi:hypothetical protein